MLKTKLPPGPSALQPVDERRNGRAMAVCALRRQVGLVGISVPVLLAAGCASSPSTLNTHGARAAKIVPLWWLMLAIGGTVFVIVVALFLIAALRPRRRRGEEPIDGSDTSRSDRLILLIAGALVPAIILVVVFSYSVHAMQAFTGTANANTLTVEVLGHQWWWEVRYPGHGVTTANEIHMPAGQQVLFKLTSVDVIHSFWVPQLQAKEDAIPGQTNTLWVEADDPGSYRGQCAEFCGLQHAHMALLVIADPPDRFNAWLQQESQPAAQPTTADEQKGQQAFLSQSCSYCHAIKGTSASGRTGPDLTHLGSRSTLAAGTLVNTPGNLGGWIANPDYIKPDSHMPPSDVDGPTLLSIVDYLESLK